MFPVRYTSDVWVAFSFVEVFFGEWFFFVREYSDDRFSSHVGDEEIIQFKVDRFLSRWRAVMLIRVRFGKLCGTGIDFFEAVVEGRV